MYKLINWYAQRFRFPHRGWKFARWWMKLTGALDRIYTKKLRNGYLMQVNPTEHIQQQLFWYGYYEKEVIAVWETLMQSDFTVLDIGANTGYYSLIASRKAKQVYAFEPSSVMRIELEQNIALNSIQNISIEPYAVSDQSGVATIYLSGSDNTGMSGLQPPENFSGATEQVNMISIDDWIVSKGSPRINAIKIDVEGAEMKVLKGMRQLLLRVSPEIVLIEVIDSLLSKYGNKTEDIFNFFTNAGYKPFEVLPGPKIRELSRSEWSKSEMILFIHS